MRTYIIRRLLLIIPVLVGISIIIFFLTQIGGEPASAYLTEHMSKAQVDAVYEKYHFNDPVETQYFYWLDGVLHGDWGVSRTQGSMPVTDAIAILFPATFELAIFSMIIAVVIGLYFGTVSAVKRDTLIDHSTRMIALTAVSMPIFVFSLILLFIFYAQLGWLPFGGRYDAILFMEYSDAWHQYTGFFLIDSVLNGNYVMFIDGLKHIILPAVALGLSSFALFTRMMRSSMLEVLGLDYIRSARAKGLPEKVVINKHARRNALIPTTTVAGMAFGSLLGGAVITETIFQWPGLGRWSTMAITVNDSASIMGFVLLVAIIFMVANLVVDILYAYLDPRVKLG